MKIIIPMAGRGTRLRPHTVATPKPLLPIAGKTMVARIVEELIKTVKTEVSEIAFIIGDFGAEVEKDLIQAAQSLGSKGVIYHQDKPLGTAHATLCAAPSLSGPVIIAFADTLFKAAFDIDPSRDSVIWVNRVEKPESFGVVTIDDSKTITGFVEKPKDFVSDLAIIGIYYFKDGENLKHELQYLIDHDIKDKGEYQITSALENMRNKGVKFGIGEVEEWLDCGNKDATLYAHSRTLFHIANHEQLIAQDAIIENSTIIPPTYLGSKVVVKNSVIGPFVSLENNTHVESSVINNSIIRENAVLKQAMLTNSMVGKNVQISYPFLDVSLGDYTIQK